MIVISIKFIINWLIVINVDSGQSFEELFKCDAVLWVFQIIYSLDRFKIDRFHTSLFSLLIVTIHQEFVREKKRQKLSKRVVILILDFRQSFDNFFHRLHFHVVDVLFILPWCFVIGLRSLWFCILTVIHTKRLFSVRHYRRPGRS